MPKTEPFDAHSDAYDAWFDRNRDAYEAEIKAVRRLLPAPGARGIEVGVGSGKFAAPLGVRLGLEPSRAMARKARDLGVSVCLGAAENLPLRGGKLDFVLMVTTVCFVDDVARALAEAFRVLAPGGCIVVGFVDRESEIGATYLEKRAGSRFYRDATFFSAAGMLRLLEQAGFRSTSALQTLIPGEQPGTVREGFGAGGFVVMRGER
jgi:SAM-dependent methyltransferase